MDVLLDEIGLGKERIVLIQSNDEKEIEQMILNKLSKLCDQLQTLPQLKMEAVGED